MVKKKWLARESLAEERDARRTERIAVLVPDARIPKLNENQTAILAEIAAAGGRMRVDDLRESIALRELGVPASTLATLVKRGLVAIEEVPEDFHLGGIPADGKKNAHEHALNEAQMEALSSIAAAMAQGWIQAPASLRHHQLGQDHRLLRRDAARAGRGQVRASAGPGDWPHARDGGPVVRGLRPAGRAAALRPYAGRTRRAVAPHPPRRGPHRRRHALGCLRSDGQPRPHPGGRGAGRQLQAGGDAALPRARCRRDARQVQLGRRRARLSHALAGKLGQLRTRPLRTHRDAHPRDAAPAAHRRTGRHANRIPRNRPRRHLLPPARRRDTGHARPRRAGDGSAQPARLLLHRALPKLRREDRVRELRHRHDVPYTTSPLRRRTCTRTRATGWSATTAAFAARSRSSARSAGASTSFISARARSRARSGCRNFFPARASGAWTATPCADAERWSACSRGSTQARSIFWSARR